MTSKLRTARDVIDRILWDQIWDAHRVVFGYEDRLVGVMEMKVSNYQKMEQGGEIPEHRILYFRRQAEDSSTIRDEDILWDRKSRIDRIFGSGQDQNNNDDKKTNSNTQTVTKIPPETLEIVRQAIQNTERLHAEEIERQERQEHEVKARQIRKQLAAQHLTGATTADVQSMDVDDNQTQEVTGRKRQLDEISNGATSSPFPQLDLLRFDASGKVTELPSKVRKLRLEAIFHPKFENESQTDKDIRNKMMKAVESGQGYLEVSLKHSGSLLLWSGGQRFYSKNSTDNVFTHVGEILLRQHFCRVYWPANGETASATTISTDMFRECSEYVQTHRLTLSFETVTAVLGDHGDRPRRDFLILTAVADRCTERFWGTDEIVAFAQRFRLPHNDAWVFSSQDSVRRLFEFYDSAREDSYATDVVQAMSETADTRVESMLPHIDFQGDILEGIVIRFVPCDAESRLLEKMQELAQQSRHIATQVPSDRPDAWELLSGKTGIDPLLTINLRELYEKTKFGQRSFASAVADFINTSSNGRRRVQRVPKSVADIDVPSWTRDMTHSGDGESQRVAKLIDLLTSINVRVDYSLLREKDAERKGRWLCIIHVIHDASFQKYRSRMKPGDMPLFRGFAVEINGNDNESHENALPSQSKTQGEYLMLKMKFLPYMVRTFGCRNGLRNLRQGGVQSFVTYTNNMLSKWNISAEGRRKWVPFFRAWAEFARPRMDSPTGPAKPEMQPLTEDNYLEHLQVFQTLYESGEIAVDHGFGPKRVPTSRSQGLVVVVAPRRTMAKAVADLVAKAVGGAHRLDDVNAISRDNMETFCLQGHGVVCNAELNDGTGSLRKFVGNYGKFISIIMVGCSEDSIRADLDLAPDLKFYNGLAKSWRKIRAVLVLELDATDVPLQPDSTNPEALVATHTEKFGSEIEKLKLVFHAESQTGPRPGMLIFFPGIPGCGKSSLTDAETEKILKNDISKHSKDRQLMLRVGDKTKGKYWAIVKQERNKNFSCLYIADKNVPASTWGQVAQVCAETKAMGVPIIPDSGALETTVVKGSRKPDGSFNAERRQVYPFSLHYLAVCLFRVTSRPPKSHPGKLDGAVPLACMIVVRFYCLYRRSTAQEYRENLEHSFNQAGAVLGSPIEVPFFAKRKPEDLPADLKNLLIEVLQVYDGYSLSKQEPAETDPYILDLERRLRESLKSHAGFIQGLSIDLDESRKVFVSKFLQRVAELDSIESWTEVATGAKANFIQIASIDVNVNDAQSLLKSLCEETNDLAPLSQQMTGGKPDLTESCFTDRCFVLNTHVTMAHFREQSQKEMRDSFGSIVGESVEMNVISLSWDDRVVAFEVELPRTTMEGTILPTCKNKFTHITLWCQKGASAYLSNELPSRVEKGQAKRHVLAKPVSMTGKVALWVT